MTSFLKEQPNLARVDCRQFEVQFVHPRLGWRNVSSAHSYYEAACGGLEGDHLLSCFKASTFEMEEFMDDEVAKGNIQIVIVVFTHNILDKSRIAIFLVETFRHSLRITEHAQPASIEAFASPRRKYAKTNEYETCGAVGDRI